MQWQSQDANPGLSDYKAWSSPFCVTTFQAEQINLQEFGPMTAFIHFGKSLVVKRGPLIQ